MRSPCWITSLATDCGPINASAFPQARRGSTAASPMDAIRPGSRTCPQRLRVVRVHLHIELRPRCRRTCTPCGCSGQLARAPAMSPHERADARSAVWPWLLWLVLPRSRSPKMRHLPAQLNSTCAARVHAQVLDCPYLSMLFSVTVSQLAVGQLLLMIRSRHLHPASLPGRTRGICVRGRPIHALQPARGRGRPAPSPLLRVMVSDVAFPIHASNARILSGLDARWACEPFV